MYYNVPLLQSHTSVIVLGDSTGDPAMVAGMEAITTIKIGYLNYNVIKYVSFLMLVSIYH